MHGLLALLLTISCASAPASRIEGTWRSNRELTLRELANVERTLPSRTVTALRAPDYFGRLELTYADGEYQSVLPDAAVRGSYEIVTESHGSAWLLHQGSSLGREDATFVRFRGPHLLVPIPELGFYEVFDRVAE